MKRVLAAAVVLAAACHSTRPAPPPVAAVPRSADAGVAESRDAGPAIDDTAARAEAAWARREADPVALDQAISLWEEVALRSADPSLPLLDAARARRMRIERAQRGPDPDAAGLSADAQACAADAHRSWGARTAVACRSRSAAPIDRARSPMTHRWRRRR